MAVPLIIPDAGGDVAAGEDLEAAAGADG